MKLLESIVLCNFSTTFIWDAWKLREEAKYCRKFAKAFGKISGKLQLIARLTTIKLINRTINRDYIFNLSAALILSIDWLTLFQ